MNLIFIPPCPYTYSTIVANAGGLPAAVVSTGVALVELEAIVRIPSHI